MTTQAQQQRLKQELMALQEANPDGLLLVEKAHAWAKKNPKSELHARLEWNDEKAGYAHRLWQIREMIKIIVVNSEKREPVFVSLSTDRSNGGGYRAVSEVVKRRNLADIMLKDAMTELERAQMRYAHVKELTAVWEEVDRVKELAKAAAARGKAGRAPQARQGSASRGRAPTGKARRAALG